MLRAGPVETTGFEASVVGSVPLKSYPSTLIDGNLRAREVVVAPGGKIAAHAHDARPAIAHILEGEVVEHRSDSDTPLIRRQGDTYVEGPGVVHWLENVSPYPVRVFSVDILPAAVDWRAPLTTGEPLKADSRIRRSTLFGRLESAAYRARQGRSSSSRCSRFVP
jgi:quercetin dioxygenase-like cupin family protein